MEKLMKSQGVSLMRNQILVFSSNINTKESSTIVCKELLKIEGISKATIDLEDWENILRLECHSSVSSHLIKRNIFKLGFDCSELK